MKIFQKDKKAKFFIFLVSIFILSQFRLIEHPWNFTPVLAFGILAGYYLRSIAYGYGLIIASMILGDLIIGFHYLIFFTYIGLLFSVIIGKYLKQLKLFQLVFSGIASSVVFFIISNFGVWLIGDFYEKSLSGLIQCYTMALPFLKNTYLGTLSFILLYLFFYNILFIIINKFYNKINNYNSSLIFVKF